MVSRKEWVDSFVSNFKGTAEQATKAFNKLDKTGAGEIAMADVYRLFKDMDIDGTV